MAKKKSALAHRALWFWPVAAMIFSVTLLVSILSGGQATGVYGQLIHQYLVEHLGQCGCCFAGLFMFVTSFRSLNPQEPIKGWIRWTAVVLMVPCVSTLEHQLFGVGSWPLNGGFLGSYITAYLNGAFGVMGPIIVMSVFSLCLVAWGGKPYSDFSRRLPELILSSLKQVTMFSRLKKQSPSDEETELEDEEEDEDHEIEELIPEHHQKRRRHSPSKRRLKHEKVKRSRLRKKVELEEEFEEEVPQFKSKPLDIEAMVKKAKAKKNQGVETEIEEAEEDTVSEPEVSEVVVSAHELAVEEVSSDFETNGQTQIELLSDKPAAQLSLKRLRRKKTKKVAKLPQVSKTPGKFKLPPIDLLQLGQELETSVEELQEINERSHALQHSLKDFGLEVQVVDIQQGPVITQYELELAPGIKVSRIMNLQNDIAMALRARSVRILAPIPGKSTCGIEVPNRHRRSVSLRELIEGSQKEIKKMELPSFLGRDIFGEPVTFDVADMPHLLMAGATGAGKSVGINSIILSILMTRSPEECKLILVDPKQVELSFYRGIPHLISPVVSDMKKVPFILDWLVRKMEERYDLLARIGVRDITAFNKLGDKKVRDKLGIKEDEEAVVDTYLPRIMIVIDELADLMMLSTASKDVESNIQRLAQKSRAVGLHVVLATQRPSVDVITGIIKANLPCRISYMVNSGTDSRTILDRKGAETLLGRGDLLFKDPSRSDLQRLQGAFVSEEEVRAVVEYLKQQGEPQFLDDLVNSHLPKDELYEKAVRLVLESGRGSTTFLQRMLGVGYTRGSRLIEMMEIEGLVGPHKGSVSREVMYTWEQYQEMLADQDEEDDYEDDKEVNADQDSDLSDEKDDNVDLSCSEEEPQEV